MTFQIKHLLRSATILLAVLTLATACNSDKKVSCGPAFSTENTVTTRLSAQVLSLNPLLRAAAYDGFVASQIITCLGTLDPKTLELSPYLVKKVPGIRKVETGPYAGNLAYDFEFYEDATWDNGKPLTAADVIFSLKVLMHPALPAGAYRGYLQYLKNVEADPASPNKFTAYFTQYYILGVETLMQFPIYPEYNYDPEGRLKNIPLVDLLDEAKANALQTANPEFAAWAEFFQQPRFKTDKTAISGAGAYRLENIDPEEGCTLVKKENWWGDKHVAENPLLGAFPTKLVYRFMKEETPVESMIRAGKLDMIPDVSPEKFLDLKKDSCLQESYDFESFSGSSYNRVLLNNRNPKLSDKRVRQALAHCVDYDYIVNSLYQGMAQRIVSPANPAKPYYAKNLVPYDYNIDKAKKLLAEAGWKDSNNNGIVDKTIDGSLVEMELNLLFAASKISKEVAQNFVSTAQSAGIRINAEEKDISIVSAKTRQPDFEMALVGAALFPGLLDLYQNFHTLSIGADNRCNFSNAALDQLIEQIRTEPDDTKRNVLYVKAQEIIYDEQPELCLYSGKLRMIVSKRFDYVLSANRPGYYEQFFRLKKEQ